MQYTADYNELSCCSRMNTDVKLYSSIKAVVDGGDDLCADTYTPIDKHVAKLFLDDFEKCGIHLSEEKVKWSCVVDDNMS